MALGYVVMSKPKVPVLTLGIFFILTFTSVYAQTVPPITSSGLHTTVGLPQTLPGNVTQYDIAGGTRPGGGPNLFHSFGNFNVPNNNIANFLNDSGLATTNILGRVTGGNVSNIFGAIQTTGFGNANLFLMNPAGFLFGPNATINVGGMATFTSADYIRLADGARFNAIPDAAADALISAAPVAAFGFLGSDPGAIIVQGSQLAVAPGQGISLVGGNITVQSGTLDNGTVQTAKLSAPGGQINLVSVASPGEVLYQSLQYGPNVNGQSFTNMGSITLSQGSVVDVSADAAGTIKIRGGQLVLDNATISADTGNANGAQTAIDIQVTGDMSISNSVAPAITARTTGTGDAGEVRVSSGNLTTTTSASDLLSVIDTHTSGSGKAGNVSITTGTLQADGHGATVLFIDSGFIGTQGGHGGDVSIIAGQVTMNGVIINTGDYTATLQGTDARGSAGNVSIVADAVQLALSGIQADGGTDPTTAGVAGDITLTANTIRFDRSIVSAVGFEGGGLITMKTDTLTSDNTQIATGTFVQPRGGVNISGRVVELTNGTAISSDTGGDGDAGPIHVTATDHLQLSGFIQDGPIGRPTGLFSNSFGVAGDGNGNAGTIVISTPHLTMTDGARINTTTLAGGRGGDLVINAQSVSLSGEFPSMIPEPLFSPGVIHPGGITTVTTGESCAGPCGGNAGNVSIRTGTLSIANGAHIDSGTSSLGRGGNISINTNTASISGTLTDGSPGGIFSRTTSSDPNAGQGGTISLTAAQSVTLSDGASIAASSTGPANAGNIFINAGQNFTATNASVKTDAAQASGGNITVNASDMVHLTNSQINASVQGAQTTIGGNVTIDPSFVILQNSQILAQATQGQGGNISITTNSLLSDTGSLISASSQSGVNGTVSVQSPISQAGGKIIPLSKTTLETAPLLSQRCAALASGQYSSFVVAGRDALPVEPGSWLASPLIELPTLRSAEMGMNRVLVLNTSPDTPEAAIVSVRRISRAGSVARLLETDWLIGCES